MRRTEVLGTSSGISDARLKKAKRFARYGSILLLRCMEFG